MTFYGKVSNFMTFKNFMTSESPGRTEFDKVYKKLSYSQIHLSLIFPNRTKLFMKLFGMTKLRPKEYSRSKFITMSDAIPNLKSHLFP